MPDVRDQPLFARVGPIGQALALATAIMGLGVGGLVGALAVDAGADIIPVASTFWLVTLGGLMLMFRTEREEVEDA